MENRQGSLFDQAPQASGDLPAASRMPLNARGFKVYDTLLADLTLGRMDAPFEDVADHAGGVRPGLLSPADQPLWRPLGVLAMALGHVLGLCAVPALVR